MPIVEVHNVRREAEGRQALEQPATKQHEAALLVPLVLPEIDAPVSPKEAFVLEEVDRDERVGQRGLQQIDSFVHIAQIHGACHSRMLQVPALRRDRAIAWHGDAHVVPQRGQRFGQAPRDIRDPALLGEWRHLCRNEQDVEAGLCGHSSLVGRASSIRRSRHCARAG